jgi:aspartate/methionine/tyrosine aminotransferase
MILKPFELERYFARYEFNARYLLSSSDCESWTIEELLKRDPEAAEKFKTLSLGYIESQGTRELRARISWIYKAVSEDEILVHSGAEEAIFLFMQAALQAGDEVIVHQPCYQALAEVPRALGCEVIPWRARPESGWALNLDELRSLLSPKTRAIVVNLPHNPTGYLMPRNEFSALAMAAHERGITLFSDEVYRESEYSAGDRLPAACDLSESAVSLGVMSKTYGLAGLRIGWVATRNARLLKRMAELKDYTTICNSAPSEFLATLALAHREKLAERNLGLIQQNLNTLDAFFEKHSDQFSWARPKAGPIAFPKWKKGDSQVLSQRSVNEAGVMILPGRVFGDSYLPYFRIGFGRKNLPDALAQFEKFLAAPV